MGHFHSNKNFLAWQEGQQRLWIRPWGVNGLRVQANLSGGKPLDLPQALLPLETPPATAFQVEIGEESASIRCGALRAVVTRAGRVQFMHAVSGKVLLEEPQIQYFAPPNRHFKDRDGRLYQIEAWFQSNDGEKFYGLGQHQHGRLDNKGSVIELQQRNTEVSIPFMVSNRGYGFLWNNPGLGRVELGINATRWVAYGSQQLDYYVVCGDDYAEILQRYADVTGHAPVIPEWAGGFWQCKLRYETQAELLTVAREYKRRGLPLSVIVSDFFHWSHMGDWRFDPKCWPDPSAMTKELDEMGVKLMVSVWPTVSPLSENYAEMKERGLLIGNERGVDAQHVFIDHDVNGPAYFAYYDATNPEGRDYIWDKVKKGYYDHGVRLFWLDNDEPDANPWNPENLRFHLGNGIEVANIYPLLHQGGFYDALRRAGESEVVTLSRSGWAGSQRYSSIIWSGDIASTFEALQAQVRAGLNMAMSGIPWWTSDIGGFHGGNIHSEYFRELIVRWFQFGVFCPIFRLHGYRNPAQGDMTHSGADNEVWSFGQPVYQIITHLMMLREMLRPYIQKQMKIASQSGLPPMRPLFVDFPADPACETIEDQFMFGAEILVAPVLHLGERQRRVYLPVGVQWVNAWTGQVFEGGQMVSVPAPLEQMPVFLKEGSSLTKLFQVPGE